MKSILIIAFVLLGFGYISYGNQTWHKEYVNQGEERGYVIVETGQCAEIIDPYSWIKSYPCRLLALSPKETQVIDEMRYSIPLRSIFKGDDNVYNNYIIFNKIFVEYYIIYQDDKGEYTQKITSSQYEKYMNDDTKKMLINAMMQCVIWYDDNSQ